MSPTIKLFEDGYEAPTRIQMRLRQNEGAKETSPIMTGYVIITKAMAEKLLLIMQQTEQVEVFMSVGVWDNPRAPEGEKYPYTGKLEYTDQVYRPPSSQALGQARNTQEDIWY